LRKTTSYHSYDILSAKIGPTVFSAGREAKNPGRIDPYFLVADVRDTITCFKFGDNRLRGLVSAEGQILPFLIDVDGRPYNTLTLPCECVITAILSINPLADPQLCVLIGRSISYRPVTSTKRLHYYF